MEYDKAIKVFEEFGFSNIEATEDATITTFDLCNGIIVYLHKLDKIISMYDFYPENTDIINWHLRKRSLDRVLSMKIMHIDTLKILRIEYEVEDGSNFLFRLYSDSRIVELFKIRMVNSHGTTNK